jgi:hypothetical protein
MEQHVKIVAVLNIVLGGLGVCGALFFLLVFGGLAGIAGSSGDADAQAGAAILGTIGGIVSFFIALVSVPSIIAGVGLLKFRDWARTLTIVISILNLISIPFGTAVGIYGLWVLFNKDTAPLFKARSGSVLQTN